MRTKYRPKKNNRSTKLVLGIIIAVVILFTFLSLGCYIFGLNTPETNYCGWLGHYIAFGLYFAFAKASIMVPLLLAVAAIISLFAKPPWRKFSGICVLVFGMFLTASLLSFQTGAPFVRENFGGWLGAFLGKFFSPIFGFGTYALPAIAILWGFGLWLGRPAKKYLSYSLFIVLLGLFLELFLAYFAPGSLWYVPGTKIQFPLAGSLGITITVFLKNLLGPVGTPILLIAGLAVVLAVFITIPVPRGASVSLLKKLVISLRKPAHKPVTTPKPASRPAPTEPAVKEPKPARVLPEFDLNQFQESFLQQLDKPGPEDQVFKDPAESAREAKQLLDKLLQFGINGKVSGIVSGPMVTRFEFEPAPGIKINRIENLADDLSLALSAERIRILAPIPGKNAVGIEIPNKERRIVYLRDILTSQAFKAEKLPLGFALGTTITGEPYCANLRTMPHILIAGTTGSGKSVCINSIICSVIYRASYHEVRLLTIDPKQLELPVYNSVPHLLNRTTIDPKNAVGELTRVIRIMEVRYGEFANLGVRDIAGYNARAQAEGFGKKPYIVVIIDELADLMLRAPNEIEERITRLAQMSRAVGIHLILATQRPSVDVITGLIKANFPCRIAFQVASKTDSRTILDMNGAESLLGRGDMLFLPPGKGEPIRLHGSFVSASATKRVVDLWTIAYLTELLTGKVQNPTEKAKAIVQKDVVDILYDPEKSGIRKKRQDLYSILPQDVADELINQDYYEPLPEVKSGAVEKHIRQQEQKTQQLDEKFVQAARLVIRHHEASVSMLQRRLDVGWARAGRIIDQMEQMGIVGPYVGSKSRKVTIENETQLQKLLDEIGYHASS
ncbi:hypothetical protein CH330_04220 [candidate division WOR-3 bacterium JGI_Cruoil_03_51_56]|uniref:FtsK domain-containing protein n=1 Tax=candidate division WOR-3 bacterium JGI_Cruoil_03_51_56 TaxID=1973747 RepID=A0A235BW07_UNCW3|nr:MAG: hypothetical protein CH330_04220 [candidate division WOR-3 bacterium JGI_Cruoil_03_51_56]